MCYHPHVFAFCHNIGIYGHFLFSQKENRKKLVVIRNCRLIAVQNYKQKHQIQRRIYDPVKNL